MENLSDYLHGYPDEGFNRRRKLSRSIQYLPRLLKRRASGLIWMGPYRHLRHFDHTCTFTRGKSGLMAMNLGGKKFESTPFDRLIGRIDRPVTIVATGPSALSHDWAALRDSGRMIVGLTGGATFLKERGLTPDLLVLTDPDFSSVGGYHIRDAEGVPLAIEYRAAAALEKHFPGTLGTRQFTLLERINRWYGAPALSRERLRELNVHSGSPFILSDTGERFTQIAWSHRLDLGFGPSATVSFVALQILVALGATDIEIIGMDLGGGASVYASARPSRLEVEYSRVILPSFQLIPQALQGTDIRIRNLSPICPLPAEVFTA